jgi:hypothetical protein
MLVGEERGRPLEALNEIGERRRGYEADEHMYMFCRTAKHEQLAAKFLAARSEHGRELLVERLRKNRTTSVRGPHDMEEIENWRAQEGPIGKTTILVRPNARGARLAGFELLYG